MVVLCISLKAFISTSASFRLLSLPLCVCVYITLIGLGEIGYFTFNNVFFVFFTQSEHIGLSAYDIIHEDDHANVRTALTDAESKVLDRPGSKRERHTRTTKACSHIQFVIIIWWQLKHQLSC